MYVKGFKIGFDKNKVLWLIILGAVTIAVFLISISFVLVYKNLDNQDLDAKTFDLKDIKAYKADYTLNVKSNKNQNNYKINEEYKENEGGNDYFVFNISNNDAVVVYTIDNNTLNIKSSSQKLEYTLSDYIVKKENLISISTFLDLYKNIDFDRNDGFSITIEENDDKITYRINVNLKDEILEDYKFLSNISKLEVIVDKANKKINEYIIYDKNQNAYIDIIYYDFVINM